MAVRLEGIHFLVTYRCTYACDHCFVWGSPDAEGTMTLAQLTSVIDQAKECGVTDVYFEGGEPTLAYPVVLAAAKHARERGLGFGVVSNCFWATSPEDARLWLEPFVELGIADLSLSSYAYFVEDADEEHLRNAVQTATELGLPMAVLEVGAPACLDIPGACSGDVGEVMYKGRAAVALAPGRATRPPDTLVTCPYEDFTDPGRAHVGPDGELQICQGISAGNVFAGGLAAVLDGYDPHARPVIREIVAGGPWALAQAFGHAPRRDLYADECHLCYEVRSALRERFPDVLAPAQCYGLTAEQAASAVSSDNVNAVASSTVRIAPFTRADFPRLLAWAISPEFLMQWAGPMFKWPLDEAQLEAYLAPTRLDPPPRVIWRAEDLSGVPVGHLELNIIDRGHRSAVLARVLVEPAQRGQGLGRAMIAQALDVAFGDLGLHRVELRVFDFNVSALRCYDSLGFVREGVWRDASRVGDTYWSVICCSLLEDEWRQRQTIEEGT